MGIDVSHARVVTISDRHENGVDTSLAGNPTTTRRMAIPMVFVFSRNHKGSRRDDGNPLIHALKSRRGFSIAPFGRQLVMRRARDVLRSVAPDLQGFDHCMPMPSSSPFCGEFAAEVSAVAGAPILPPAFLRKKLVGEILQEIVARPPRIRTGLKGAYTSQLHAWQNMDPHAEYQAKEVDTSLRTLFSPLVLQAEPPQLRGRRVLIVDDLFATGSSLFSARNIIQNQLGAAVKGVFFLSGV